jgi:hypothetical protein
MMDPNRRHAQIEAQNATSQKATSDQPTVPVEDARLNPIILQTQSHENQGRTDDLYHTISCHSNVHVISLHTLSICLTPNSV